MMYQQNIVYVGIMEKLFILTKQKVNRRSMGCHFNGQSLNKSEPYIFGQSSGKTMQCFNYNGGMSDHKAPHLKMKNL